MSWVTDVILCFSMSERYIETNEVPEQYIVDEDRIIDDINKWLMRDDYWGTLKQIDNDVGGNKAMQACVYAGAFNWLDIDGFMQMLISLPWNEPEHVQVLIKDEMENRFRLRTLTDNIVKHRGDE